jgi:hypothetical protein
MMRRYNLRECAYQNERMDENPKRSNKNKNEKNQTLMIVALTNADLPIMTDHRRILGLSKNGRGAI